MKTYTTSQGDMWDSIAYRVMGSCKHTGTLITANIAYKDIYRFPAGVKLIIPDIKEDTYALLPPWKVKKNG